MPASPAHEFTRRVLLARIGPQPFRQQIEASESERAALARRFDLESLASLSARVEIAPRGREMFLLKADFAAEFAQTCSITLEPVPGAVEGHFELIYGPPEAEETVAGAGVEDDLAFEPLTGDSIDIGEAVAQEFSLALPEFPRAPGADLEAEMPPQPDEVNPFTALAALRGRYATKS